MKGAVLWLTGVPGSGKTTTARRLVDHLAALDHPTLWLDSDDLRRFVPVGYDEAGRDAFYRLLGHLAHLGASGGSLVIVSATASRRAYRDEVRALLGARYVEVALTANPDVLRSERDVKGLYAQAAQGEITTLPGHGAPYEPGDPDLVIDTSTLTPDLVAARVLDRLRPLTQAQD